MPEPVKAICVILFPLVMAYISLPMVEITGVKIGLDSTEHISKIVIDPSNSSIIYVSAPGPLVERQ